MEGKEMAETDKPKRRVSLFAVLMVITCIVCYLAGHLNGYRLRRAEEKLTQQPFPMTYSVHIAPELASDRQRFPKFSTTWCSTFVKV